LQVVGVERIRHRVDVSSEAGPCVQSITDFSLEELLGVNAEPYVRMGRFQKGLGF
jgi:hypothetical protein